MAHNNWFQMTPLMIGCASQNFTVDYVLELLEHFPEVFALGEANGYSALHNAVSLARSNRSITVTRAMVKVEALLATDPTLVMKGRKSPIVSASETLRSNMDEDDYYEREMSSGDMNQTRFGHF